MLPLCIQLHCATLPSPSGSFQNGQSSRLWSMVGAFLRHDHPIIIADDRTWIVFNAAAA
jgi:hypothetical protein